MYRRGRLFAAQYQHHNDNHHHHHHHHYPPLSTTPQSHGALWPKLRADSGGRGLQPSATGNDGGNRCGGGGSIGVRGSWSNITFEQRHVAKDGVLLVVRYTGRGRGESQEFNSATVRR